MGRSSAGNTAGMERLAIYKAVDGAYIKGERKAKETQASWYLRKEPKRKYVICKGDPAFLAPIVKLYKRKI